MVHRISHPMAGGSRSSNRNKVVCAAEAVRLIHDGDTIATGGFVGIGFAEGIALALEQPSPWRNGFWTVKTRCSTAWGSRAI